MINRKRKEKFSNSDNVQDFVSTATQKVVSTATQKVVSYANILKNIVLTMRIILRIMLMCGAVYVSVRNGFNLFQFLGAFVCSELYLIQYAVFHCK